jgi:hypothetical protein
MRKPALAWRNEKGLKGIIVVFLGSSWLNGDVLDKLPAATCQRIGFFPELIHFVSHGCLS